MMDRELFRQALDALELIDEAMPFPVAKLTIKNLRERLAQPEQEPVAHTTGHCENHKQKGGCQLHNLQCGWPDCDRKPITTSLQSRSEQAQWDAIPDAFNEWWDADYDDTGNPYRKDSPAYWAWSGWKAASKQPEQEPVAWEDVLGAIARGWTHDDNKHKTMDVQLAVAIAKEIQDMVIAPPERKPLTVEEVIKLIHPIVMADLSDEMTDFEIVRAVEAAHGIKVDA